jgi:hypothetical protein
MLLVLSLLLLHDGVRSLLLMLVGRELQLVARLQLVSSLLVLLLHVFVLVGGRLLVFVVKGLQVVVMLLVVLLHVVLLHMLVLALVGIRLLPWWWCCVCCRSCPCKLKAKYCY